MCWLAGIQQCNVDALAVELFDEGVHRTETGLVKLPGLNDCRSSLELFELFTGNVAFLEVSNSENQTAWFVREDSASGLKP